MSDNASSDSSAHPVTPPDDIRALLIRYYTGECDAIEHAQVAEYIARSPREQLFVQAFERELRYNDEQWTSLDVHDALSRWRERSGVPQMPPRSPVPASRLTPSAVSFTGTSTAAPLHSSRWSFRVPFMRSAGIRAMLVGSLALLLTGTGLTLIAIRSGFGWQGDDARPTYITGPGQANSVWLADGSRIHLTPRSQITVASDFGTRTRSITLSGEAYFEVDESVKTPFSVQTGAVVTHVLGTAFTVRKYDTDDVVRVAVISGKVSTGGRRAPITLTAGTIGFVTDSTARAAVVENMETYVGWTKGRLQFEDTPVSTMLAEVGHWYGYTFKLADSSIATQRVTAVFKTGDREETLIAIKHLLNVKMIFQGTSVILVAQDSSIRDIPRSRQGSDLFPISKKAS